MIIKIKAEFDVDADILMNYMNKEDIFAGNDFNYSDAISAEFGWLEESGFSLKNWVEI